MTDLFPGQRGSRLPGPTGRVDPRTPAFVAVAAVLVLTLGPDFAVVVRNALRGRRLGVATSVGTISGLPVHTVAAALGLSAVLAASALAFTLLKVAGAGYLCLGMMRALLSAGSHGAAHQDLSQSAAPLPAGLAFRHSLLTNVLDPKAPPAFSTCRSSQPPPTATSRNAPRPAPARSVFTALGRPARPILRRDRRHRLSNARRQQAARPVVTRRHHRRFDVPQVNAMLMTIMCSTSAEVGASGTSAGGPALRTRAAPLRAWAHVPSQRCQRRPA